MNRGMHRVHRSLAVVPAQQSSDWIGMSQIYHVDSSPILAHGHDPKAVLTSLHSTPTELQMPIYLSAQRKFSFQNFFSTPSLYNIFLALPQRIFIVILFALYLHHHQSLLMQRYRIAFSDALYLDSSGIP